MTPLPRFARASLALLVFALLPARAHAAQGLNLRWNACLGDGGVQNRSFACNTNIGLASMYGSFVLASDMNQVIGTEVVLQLAADSPTLPAWWQFKNAGACRVSSLSVSTVDATAANCYDWSGGLMFGGLGAYCTVAAPCTTPPPGANVAVIKVINAVQPNDATPIVGGDELYDFTINIANQKTVGTGACAGCTTPVCIVLNSINVVAQDNLEQRFISTPTVPGSNYVTWQGGGSPGVGGAIGCPAATATQRSTWGGVKTLYR